MECKDIKKRKLWIDLSKVMLIYLMVVCHLGVAQVIDTTIVSFHMSAFFLISGYLHRDGDWWGTVKKAIKRLLVPVLFFNLLGYCVWIFHNSDVPFTLNEYITKPIIGLVMLNPSVARPMCMPMWFCIVLFFAKFLFGMCKNRRMKIIAFFICLILSIVLLYIKFSGSNFIGRIFLGTLFYIIGYLLRGNIDRLLLTKQHIRIIIAVGAFIFLCGISLYNGRPTWLNYEFGKSFLFFICTSILGALLTFVLSSLIYKKTINIISYLSKNTLTILGVHLLLFPLLPHVNNYIGAFIVLVYCLPIIWIFNRFVPVLIGNK